MSASACTLTDLAGLHSGGAGGQSVGVASASSSLATQSTVSATGSTQAGVAVGEFASPRVIVEQALDGISVPSGLVSRVVGIYQSNSVWSYAYADPDSGPQDITSPNLVQPTRVTALFDRNIATGFRLSDVTGGNAYRYLFELGGLDREWDYHFTGGPVLATDTKLHEGRPLTLTITNIYGVECIIHVQGTSEYVERTQGGIAVAAYLVPPLEPRAIWLGEQPTDAPPELTAGLAPSTCHVWRSNLALAGDTYSVPSQALESGPYNDVPLSCDEGLGFALVNDTAYGFGVDGNLYAMPVSPVVAVPQRPPTGDDQRLETSSTGLRGGLVGSDDTLAWVGVSPSKLYIRRTEWAPTDPPAVFDSEPILAVAVNGCGVYTLTTDNGKSVVKLAARLVNGQPACP